ncbi:secretory carrier-associated membrane protein 2-like [Argentina anserina]|uniref:secretory carrier-associated membrane protein 2-like n=1 Tax=Argentina anserina TaxID=57926 RepID=UPI00217653F9|nr:secretory carrier-associated membrane protein 2-like [Potentilla anserina]
MSSYDANPFAEEEVNPFADSRGPKPLPPERYDRGATVDIPLDNPSSLKGKEKELRAREAELKRKENEIRRREETIASGGVISDEKNFPAFWPIIHHDIPNDIPVHLQKIMYVGFTTYISFIGCLLWSIIAVSVYWFFAGGVWGINNWILAVVHFIVWPPIDYFLWYRPLYRAMRTDSALSFALFFFFYSGHIVYCIYSAAAPPTFWGGYSIAGLVPAILLTVDDFVTTSIFYFLGAALFAIEALMSIWVLKQVYTYFRSSGKSQSMRRDALRAAI